jgi:hypothetical protein
VLFSDDKVLPGVIQLDAPAVGGLVLLPGASQLAVATMAGHVHVYELLGGAGTFNACRLVLCLPLCCHSVREMQIIARLSTRYARSSVVVVVGKFRDSAWCQSLVWV